MSVSDLPQCLHEILERERIRSGKILVAVSGGADSMALLRGLQECAASLRLEVRAAHLNHQLRGADSDADAEWLELECARLEIPLTVGRAEVSSLAESVGDGVEAAARDLRYQFLARTANEQQCQWVAVAHSADDQAETVLHNLIRGTGLAGLRGMTFSRVLQPGVSLLRPLLDVSRSDLRAYLQELRQAFRNDASNEDLNYTRNRIRQKLLPLLANEFNPQIGAALCRLAQQAADVQATMEQLASELLERVLESEGPRECQLKWQPLANAPRHLVREVFSALWRRRDWPRQAMTFDHWEQLATIAQTGGAADFPGGLEIRREGRVLTIRKPA